MNEQELFAKLKSCLPAMLTEIAVKLQLDPAYLPGPYAPHVAHANAILELVRQRGPEAVAALIQALNDVTGPRPDIVQSNRPRSILIIASNPIDTDRLRLDREIKTIKERLDESAPGRSYRVEVEWAVSPSELTKYILKYQPTIVHVCGHSTPLGEIVLEGASGTSELVSGRALANLFDTLKGTETIVLNSCYSQAQAEALARVVPQVIGMAREIGDDSAVRFAGGFYRGIAHGKDYATAFRLGCVEIDIAALPDALVPHFITHSQNAVVDQVAYAATPESISLRNPVRTWRSTKDSAAPPPRQCTLWYGTNRRPVDAAHALRGYSGERDEQTVHYGQCKVAVPKSHKIGSLGSSWWKRLISAEDDRLRLIDLSPLAATDYWQSIRTSLAQWEPGERRAFVFIHGFNVSFEEAALRTAQIATDLQLPGIPAFYSWPSRGAGVRSYEVDAASIEASERQITEFLTSFAAESGAERVDVLAHSMGNRALLRSLQRIMQPNASIGKALFGQLLLAAPDIDAGLFRDLAQIYPQLAQKTTLYISSKDRALATSGIVHDHPRAGYAPPVTVVPGIDTVEVSNVDLTFLGHGYYGAARDVLHDMHSLIIHGAPPEERMGLLNAKTSDGLPYWQIGA
jgi:esterase/lipase superfamily enzyme